jgi:hypothetical protein
VAPVVRNGGRDEICAASIRTQPVFEHFEILRLEAPLRQADDPDFAAFLDAIGDDTSCSEVDLGRIAHSRSPQEVIDFVFPAEVVADPEECMRRAILSPFNEAVNEFNADVLDRIPGDTHTYFSQDWIEDEDHGAVDMETSPLATPEFLNATGDAEPGIPPHELHLKVGSVVRFIRNLSYKKGITKNTRAIVRHVHRFSVEVETQPRTVSGRPLPSVGGLQSSHSQYEISCANIICRQPCTYRELISSSHRSDQTILCIANSCR